MAGHNQGFRSSWCHWDKTKSEVLTSDLSNRDDSSHSIPVRTGETKSV